MNQNTPMHRARILLADDCREILGIVAQVLAADFDIVAAVENGQLAVEAAATLDPDVVILDVAMPVMNGFEAATRLKTSGARAKVIFLTVHAQPEFMAAAFSAGARGYVCKPRLLSDLLPLVRKVLEDQTSSSLSPGIDERAGAGRTREVQSERLQEIHPADFLKQRPDSQHEHTAPDPNSGRYPHPPSSRLGGGVVAKILVVDDEPQLADTLAIIFQRAGYAADSVYSGEEALAFVTAHQPSLVVTDVIMPGMNGIALAKAIRVSNPNCQVLLFSGNADTQELLQAAQKDGQDCDILAKPVSPKQMLEKVASFFHRTSGT